MLEIEYKNNLAVIDVRERILLSREHGKSKFASWMQMIRKRFIAKTNHILTMHVIE